MFAAKALLAWMNVAELDDVIVITAELEVPLPVAVILPDEIVPANVALFELLSVNATLEPVCKYMFEVLLLPPPR